MPRISVIAEVVAQKIYSLRQRALPPLLRSRVQADLEPLKRWHFQKQHNVTQNLSAYYWKEWSGIIVMILFSVMSKTLIIERARP